jgi:hypothetical protein
MGKRYSKEIREEVLGKIRGGQRVSEGLRYQRHDDTVLGTWYYLLFQKQVTS